jgi:ADP-ribosylglycohydrolase
MTSAAVSPDPARLARTLLSLTGLSVGDAFGERFFGHPPEVLRRIEARRVPPAPWGWTDDTAMALSVVEVLRERGHVEQDALARAFGRRFSAQPDRGYGGGARTLLTAISEGAHWEPASRELFNGGGSKGNGAAMRVGPLGAWFADNVEQAAEQAALCSRVTHAHPDGVAGGVAMAVAAASAWKNREVKDRAARILADVVRLTPDSDTREGLRRAEGTPFSQPVSVVARNLGSGRQVLSMDTVPFAVWCACRHLDSFEEALWQTVSGLGDRDTTCAMVGSIVALTVGSSGIPGAWVRAREPIVDAAAAP